MMQKMHAIKPSLAYKTILQPDHGLFPPQKPSVKKTKTKDKIAGDVTLVFYELDITVL